MTFDDELAWKNRGVQAINAEQDRLIAVWLERRCGTRFRAMRASVTRYVTPQHGQRDQVVRRRNTSILCTGSRADVKAFARRQPKWSDALIWVEHEDAPAVSKDTCPSAIARRSA